ncbi:hypothetical protein TIFTF001_031636 [Ficus carica]|uniref:Uncharacterized protein n=1 Tax=Ficus carica TaxID=3494 RepID=A0AA88J189_FICCA|nr:hypothetical protein TIFTF001_031636 [Ficus carica]
MPSLHSLASSLSGRLLAYSMNWHIAMEWLRRPALFNSNHGPNQNPPTWQSCTYNLSYAPDLSFQQGTTTDRILNGFEWNRDLMPNKKHEPWYVRTPQSAMDGLIDKSYERHGIL